MPAAVSERLGGTSPHPQLLPVCPPDARNGPRRCFFERGIACSNTHPTLRPVPTCAAGQRGHLSRNEGMHTCARGFASGAGQISAIKQSIHCECRFFFSFGPWNIRDRITISSDVFTVFCFFPPLLQHASAARMEASSVSEKLQNAS